jgi:DNA-binding winged helix-turn-helix (wHTH) protein
VELPPKAADLLHVLLQNRGRTVTKAELLDKVWTGTAVEDAAITYQVHLIRRALRQGQDGHEYIENIPRRGYRFAAPVIDLPSGIPTARAATAEPAATQKPPDLAPPRPAILYLAVAVLGVAVVVSGGLAITDRRPPLQVGDVLKLARDPDSANLSILFTDGHLVYYPDERGQVFAVPPVKGGQATPFIDPPSGFQLVDMSLVHPEFLALKPTPGPENELWVLPASGHPRKVGDILCSSAAWSRDARRIVYVTATEMYVASSDGFGTRKLRLPGGGYPALPRWSPSGDVIRFTLKTNTASAVTQSLWEVRADGSGLHQLLAGWNTPPAECCGSWTPDGNDVTVQGVLYLG